MERVGEMKAYFILSFWLFSDWKPFPSPHPKLRSEMTKNRSKTWGIFILKAISDEQGSTCPSLWSWKTSGDSVLGQKIEKISFNAFKSRFSTNPSSSWRDRAAAAPPPPEGSPAALESMRVTAMRRRAQRDMLSAGPPPLTFWEDDLACGESFEFWLDLFQLNSEYCNWYWHLKKKLLITHSILTDKIKIQIIKLIATDETEIDIWSSNAKSEFLMQCMKMPCLN